MTYWSWFVLTFLIQLVVPIVNPKGYQRGKFLTMPMRRHLKWFDSRWCRVKQTWFVLVPVQIIASFFIHHSYYLFFIGMIALYLDDWLTNHDDFKRFGDWVRNKIKWKMELPQPATDRMAS